jgi:hypothetical protein
MFFAPKLSRNLRQKKSAKYLVEKKINFLTLEDILNEYKLYWCLAA